MDIVSKSFVCNQTNKYNKLTMLQSTAAESEKVREAAT